MAHCFSRVSPALVAAAVCALAVLTGCQRKGIEDLLSNDLFSLSLGKLEDQVDLFQFEGAMTERRNTVFMRDGWFYIANGNAGKIMVFSSYGDLIFLLYNPQTNPAPTSLGPVDAGAEMAPGAAAGMSPGATAPSGSDQPAPDAGSGGAAQGASNESTRGAVAYAFSDIGEIAVASDRTLYVDDAIADAKTVKDAARGLVLSRIVLRFDRKGRALGYVGQEGIGGTPFPYISALFVTGQDQLVVVCRLPDYSWEVSWFSRDASLLYKAVIDAAHLPVLATKKSNPVLISIIPDVQKPLLYLAIDTYTTSGISLATDAPNEVTARVYRLDLRTRQYDPTWVQFPPNPPRRERVQLKTTEIPSPPSDLLGISAGGLYYLLAYTDTNLYTLQILDPAGRLKAARRVVIEDSELTFRDVHLTTGGLLYGLFADRTRARVSWWRSDLLPTGN